MKELNQDQLEKVAGGNIIDKDLKKYLQEEYIWKHNINDVVTIEFGSQSFEAKITSRGGYQYNGSYIHAVYVECNQDNNLNGWYRDADENGTKINVYNISDRLGTGVVSFAI